MIGFRTSLADWWRGGVQSERVSLEETRYGDPRVYLNNDFDYYLSGVSDVAVAGGTAAVEAIATRVERQMSEVNVTGSSVARELLTPNVLARIGRSLLVYGESLHYLSVDFTGRKLPTLLTCDPWWSIVGDPDRSTWRITANISGPTGATHVDEVEGAFLHVLYSVRDNQPWRGIPALKRADVTAALAASIEDSLYLEARMPVKNIFPMPVDVPQSVKEQLIKSLKNRDSRTAFPGTTAGTNPSLRPQTDWKAQHIGPMPSEAALKLSTEAQARVCAAMGVHPALVGIVSGPPAGGAMLAAAKQFQDLVMDPMANLISYEASRLLGEEVTLFWPARDDVLMLRSRALKSLTDAEVPLDEAKKIARLDR